MCKQQQLLHQQRRKQQRQQRLQHNQKEFRDDAITNHQTFPRLTIAFIGVVSSTGSKVAQGRLLLAMAVLLPPMATSARSPVDIATMPPTTKSSTPVPQEDLVGSAWLDC